MLYKSIQTAIDGIYPFHMPGHKNRLIPPDLLKTDTTETFGTDNLQNPRGILKDAQAFASKIYKTKQSFFLTSGSSCGLRVAVLSAVCKTDEILLARNVHKSVHAGVFLSGAKPVYVMPSVTQEGLCGAVLPEKIETKLKENPKIKAVVITSPTPEGYVSNVKKIAEITHRYNAVLIVDEAHGAHFVFSKKFPQSAVSCGADLVVHSIHKTMCALTGAAILHSCEGHSCGGQLCAGQSCGDRIDLQKLKFMLSIESSTSPSYPIMASIDFALRSMREDLLDEWIYKLEEFRRDVPNLVQNDDIARLCFAPIDGKKFERLLFEKYKIAIEHSYSNAAVAITSIADTQDAFDKLKQAAIETKTTCKTLNLPKLPNYCKPEKTQTKSVTIDACEGEICAEFITPYPPGIPVLCPNEIIEKEHIEFLKNLENTEILSDTEKHICVFC